MMKPQEQVKKRIRCTKEVFPVKKAVTLTRMLCILLSLLMLFSSAAFADESADQEALLKKYSPCETISDLFGAGEAALADGADPKQVYEAMYYLAQSQDMLPYFLYALENAASYESESYRKLSKAVSAEKGEQELSLGGRAGRAEVSAIGFNAYGTYQVSDAFKNMIADPGAQFCLGQHFWTDSKFEKTFGTPFKKFVPSRPRAGYVCVVINNKSQTYPETSWKKDKNKDFRNTLDKTVSDLLQNIYDSAPESMPAITGNPNLASTFWYFSMEYPFYSWYGTRSNRKQVKGYNCSVSLTVIDAKTHRTIAQINQKNRLANRISWWNDDNTAQADIPELKSLNNYGGFAGNVLKAIQKEDSAFVSIRPITAINADTVINGILLEQTNGNKNAWQNAIYESGARNVALGTDSTITFRLRSYDPRVKDLGAYAGAADGKKWLSDALANASAYDLELTLPLENGQLNDAAMKTLKAAVQKAAGTAQQGFGSKDMIAALKDRFFPLPVEGKLKEASELVPSDAFKTFFSAFGLESTGMTVEQLALVLYAQKSQNVDVKAGPHAITFNCVGTEPAVLLAESEKAALDELAYAPAESRASLDRLEEFLAAKLQASAFTSHTRGSTKYAVTIDVDELSAGNPEAYTSWLSEFGPYQTVYEDLRAKAEKLPAAAAQALPKNGKLTGGGAGTKVVFKLADTADPTYVQIRGANSNEMVVSLFAYPGKQVAVNVPEGSYRLVYCSGPYWYGEETLFGDLGSYSRTDPTEIKGKQYVHTFTLEPSQDGEIPIHSASPADFR